jgi:hypothetical protein
LNERVPASRSFAEAPKEVMEVRTPDEVYNVVKELLEVQ